MTRQDFRPHPWLYLLPLLCCLLSEPGRCDPVAGKSQAFRAGEKLIFELRWLFIPAGEAVLEVLPMETMNGGPARHFVLTARSNAFFDRFYKVRDRVDSWTDPAVTRSLRYRKKQREGHTRRDVLVEFDWERRSARYTNFGKARDPIPIPPGTLDPLSAFYYARNCALAEDTEIRRPVTDGKKCVVGKAFVTKRESIRVNDVLYDTFLLEPELAHIGGVFEKSEDASIRVWVTADRRRIPVRLKSKVVVGSFTGDLIAIQNLNSGKGPENGTKRR